MRTTKPSNKTSSTIRYIMQRMPNMSHQRWGDVCRQVLMEVYSRIWAVKNQLSVIKDERSVNLTKTLNQRVGLRVKLLTVNIRLSEVSLEAREVGCGSQSHFRRDSFARKDPLPGSCPGQLVTHRWRVRHDRLLGQIEKDGWGWSISTN